MKNSGLNGICTTALAISVLVISMVAGAQSCPCQYMTPTPADISKAVPGATLKNFAQVDENIYRGSLPSSAQDYQFLKAKGIKTIFSLERFPTHTITEAKRDPANGFIYKHISVGASPLLSWENKMNAVVETLSDPSLYPIYLHCYMGSDRTSLAIGLYRVQKQNCHPADAEAEMSLFHFADFAYLPKVGVPSDLLVRVLKDDHVNFGSSAPRCEKQ